MAGTFLLPPTSHPDTLITRVANILTYDLLHFKGYVS
jgi:hypothetical protein